jgi:hypothetical protein
MCRLHGERAVQSAPREPSARIQSARRAASAHSARNVERADWRPRPRDEQSAQRAARRTLRAVSVRSRRERSVPRRRARGLCRERESTRSESRSASRERLVRAQRPRSERAIQYARRAASARSSPHRASSGEFGRCGVCRQGQPQPPESMPSMHSGPIIFHVYRKSLKNS